jgi:hypothetical protein
MPTGFEVGPMLSPKLPMTGEECILLAEIDRDMDGEKRLLGSDKGDPIDGMLIPWCRICSSSSRNLAMTEPDPFFGPRRFRTMSREHLTIQ